MVRAIYTQFPPLLAETLKVVDDESLPHHTFELPYSESDLTRAWAYLLSRYTGHDRVSFFTDTGLVSVVISDHLTSQERGADHSSEDDLTSATAVYTNVAIQQRRCKGRLAVELHLNLDSQECDLYTNGYVPYGHLPQIGALLVQILQANYSTHQRLVPVVEGVIKLSILNETPAKMPGPSLLHEFAMPITSSERVAIEYYENFGKSAQISFAELDRQACRLARIVRQRVRHETSSKRRVVPLLMPQCPELYIAMFAIMRAGCAFCPLQLDAPLERLKFIVHDVDATLIITSKNLAPRLGSIAGLEILVVDNIEVLAEDFESIGGSRNDVLDGENTAYIMYTSGSTGQPKGVPVSHKAATQSLLAHDRHIPKFSRFLQFAAPTFDVSIFEIFFTLHRGSTLVICERSLLLNDLPRTIRETRVDAAELTPTVAGGLLRSRKNASNLGLLLTIGEMLTPQVVAEFGGDARTESILWGMYGPTEAAIHCTLQSAFSKQHRPGNIGVPLDTVSAFIVPAMQGDEKDNGIQEVLPAGMVGELVVGGHQLADGYLNRDEQTAKVFVQSQQYGLLYRTGDKARILLDGTIECLGRITSSQIKLRGQRIELGEVKHAASRTPGCLDCVAAVVGDNLVAFCIVESHIQSRDVIASCRSWLPTFMVPSDVVLVRDFPRLSSGKADVKSLSDNYRSNALAHHMQLDNTTTDPTSRRVCEILSDVLSRSVAVGMNVDAIGLDSLSAIRATTLLRQAGIRITLADLLSGKTVSQLVHDQQVLKLSSQDQTKGYEAGKHPMFDQVRRLIAQKYSAAEVHEFDLVFPPTPTQLAMLAETWKNSSVYWNWIELKVNRQLDLDQVKRVVSRLSAKHGMLRAGFYALDSATPPYACVVHKQLDDLQFEQVDNFKREQTSQDGGLLRPLHVQVKKEKNTTSLLLQMHHSMYDGWSIDLLLNDLQQLLHGKVLETTISFEEISNFYLQVDRTAALDYWQDQLADFTPVSLPNFNSVQVASSHVGMESLTLATSLHRLQETAAKLKVGTPVFLQAATAQLISAYVGDADVTIGTVTSGRSIPMPGIEDVFGPCLATCPLRLDLAPFTTISELLRYVHQCNTNLLRHAIVPPQTMKQFCKVSPEQPLWDVLFVWQESLPGRNPQPREVSVVASADRLECALTIEFEPKDGKIQSRATFRSSLLSRDQVQLFLRQVDSVVQSYLDAPESSLHCIDIPDNQLSISNPSPDELTFERGLEFAVERRAHEDPDAQALILAQDISQDRAVVDSLSYMELNVRANQLAHFLRGKDLKCAELVAICMDKSVDLYIAILAVVKLGLGYLPITPSTPLKRIKSIVDEAGVHLCLTYRDIFHSLALESVCEVLNVDTVDMSKQPSTNIETEYDGSRAAYAVFTSGSTGTPKGVLVTQQNLRSNLSVLSEIYPSTPGDRLLQACSQAFDVSVFEIFFAWQEGMCLCSATNDVLFRDIEMTIRALHVTHLSLTPTVAALVDPDNVPEVRFLVTAGEGVTEKVKNMWSDRGLHQGYGPSETTNICTIKPNVAKEDVIRNIGLPLRNTSAFVFHHELDVILPKGAVGELCFGGDQVYRGYINQPKLTSSKFIQHPTYGRLYRSGDGGRILSDGSIIFAARIDDQIKIRGQRVELNEINHCALSIDELQDCATVIIDTPEASQALVSFIVPRGRKHGHVQAHDQLVLPEDQFKELVPKVWATLRNTLPSYMLPSAIIAIKAIPMTTQGKVDRRRMQAELVKSSKTGRNWMLDIDQTESEDAPNSPTALAIIDALKETLGGTLPRVGRGTSFFSLGLDSLSAIAFSRGLSKRLSCSIPISAVLRNPSITRLLQYVENNHLTNDTMLYHAEKLPLQLLTEAQDAARVAKADIVKIRPCSPLQEAMLSSSSSDASMYNNMTLFRVTGDLDLLRQCWQLMFERHEILRTTFMSTKDPLYPYLQLVLHQSSIPWAHIEEKHRAEQDHLPPAVDSFSPPVRIAVFSKASHQYLRFSCHHALYDGMAVQILLREIESAYYGLQLPPACDTTPVWSAMIAQRQNSHLQFWTDQLNGFQPSVFRCTRQTPQRVSISASKPLSEIEFVCQALSTSLLPLGQIAWAKTLSALFGEPDICFGNVISGRMNLPSALDHAVIPAFNTIPFRIDFNQHTRIIDSLRRAQRLNAASIDHQFCPLRIVQSNLGFSETGIFSSIFLLQSSQVIVDPSIWSIEHEDGAMDFPIIIELIPNRSEDRLSATLYYNTSVLYPSGAKETLMHFWHTFDEIIQESGDTSTPRHQLPQELLRQISNHTVRPTSSILRSVTSPHLFSEMSATETTICEAVAELTNVPLEQLSTSMSIHQLGLDSIGAIQLATKLRGQGLAGATPAIILRNPIIKNIAEALHSAIQANPTERGTFDLRRYSNERLQDVCAANGIPLDHIEHIWPCMPVQMGMVSQCLSKAGTYINHMTYALNSEHSAEQVLSAWQYAIERFEMLRTGFVSQEDASVPYAMAVYHPRHCTTRIRTDSDPNFDYATWRRQSCEEIQQDLMQPPWAVALQATEDKLLMHLTIFHGIYDATSLALILDFLYSKLSRKQLEPDFHIEPVLSAILHQTNTLGEEHRAYWEKALQGMTFNAFPDLTPLHVSAKTTSKVEMALGISPSTIEQRCRTKGYSIQALGQAAWAQVLSAYVGESVIQFGIVLSGRDITVDAARAALPCIVTIPFGVDLAGKTNEDLIQCTMSFGASVREHQFTKLSDIRRWMKCDMLFDTLFAYQKVDASPGHVTSHLVEDIANDEFALSLELEPSQNGFIIRATFKDDILPEKQATLLLCQYAATFRDILEHPHHPANSLRGVDQQILSQVPAERQTLDSPVNLLHDFVAFQAARIPERPAFEFFERSASGSMISQIWSYQDLNAEGNRVANYLAANGVNPGAYIGVCFEKCPEASFAMLGILKAGCAYVAIDPSAPSARKVFIAKDSNISLLFSTNRSAEHLIGVEDTVDVVYLDEVDLHAISSPVLEISAANSSPETTCYCLYTSGTTGTPKGCEISHLNAVQAMRAFSILFSGRWTDRSKWLQFASFHFDVSVLEQYWSWSEGLCVASAPRDVIFEDLEGSIRLMGITHIDLTPSLASLVHPANVPELCKGVFITGGEQLKQEILDVWGEMEAIHNGYGPTETTIGVTMFTRVPKSGKPANIGKQFANVGTYVVRPGTFDLVLRGGVGELCIAGHLVGKGYLNRPDLTAEKFPFVDHFNERVYRTGDLVRLCHDGTFLFLGRIDDQVKLRGQRLEIGEINNVIRQAATDVSGVATYVLRHPKQQNDQIVTFLVSRHSPMSSELRILTSSDHTSDTILRTRTACMEHLPGYMVPTFVVPITHMPLSTNNKTDGKALKELFNSTSLEALQNLSIARTSTLGQTESQLAKAISELSGAPIDSIHSSSNIFELGLDSISVLALSSRLKKAGFEHVSVSQIMLNPVIRKLSDSIQESIPDTICEQAVASARRRIQSFGQRFSGIAADTFRCNSDDIEVIAPCTPLQEGMISRSLVQSFDKPYFNTFRFTLGRNTDLNVLHLAWQNVFDNLQVLRTWFMRTEDGYAQVVFRKLEATFKVDNINHEQSIRELANQRRQQWLDMNVVHLRRPVEVNIWLTPHGNATMIINIFHGLYDGNCLAHLLFQVRESYHQGNILQPGPAFHLALPHGPLLERSDAAKFWKARVGRPSTNRLQILAPPRSEAFTVDLGEALESCRRKLNVTHQSLLQAAWIATVARITRSDHVSTGIVCSGRSIDFVSADQIIGPMFNTIPFCANTKSTPTWRSLVQHCHGFNVQSLPYQHTPLRNIQKWCRLTSSQGIFDTLFVFQVGNSSGTSGFSTDLWTIEHSSSAPDYPLALDVEYRSDGSLHCELSSTGSTVNGRALLEILQDIKSALFELMHNVEGSIEWRKMNGDTISTTLPVGSSSETNGHADLNFEWSPEAKTIREELSRLSQIEETQITQHISIFELGLDSIDSIKLSTRLATRGIRLPVSTIMQTGTISRMTQKISVTKKPSESSTELLNRAEVELTNAFRKDHGVRAREVRILPATPLQEAMISEMIVSEYSNYYNHDILCLPDWVNEDRLRNAWHIVYQKTPVLRTRFRELEHTDVRSTYAQVVENSGTLPWETFTVDNRDAIGEIIVKLRASTATHERPGALFSLTMIHTKTERLLLLSMPHALYDGYSLDLLHQDVRQTYHTGSCSQRPSWDATLNNILEAQVSDAVSTFWSAQLSGAVPCQIQRSQPSYQSSQAKPGVVRLELRSEVSSIDVRAFCRKSAITPQTLGQCCFSLVLSTYVRRLDVMYGLVLSGRDTIEAQHLVFPTMNTVAFRTRIAGTKSEFLQHCQQTMADIRAHQQFPLRRAQMFGIEVGARLFNSLFIYQARPQADVDLPKIYESVGSSSDVEIPVCVEMELEAEQAVWRIACHDDFLDRDAGHDLLSRMESAMHHLMIEPSEMTCCEDEGRVIIGDLPSFEAKEGSHPSITNEQDDPKLSNVQVQIQEEVESIPNLQTVQSILALVSQVPEGEVSPGTTLYHLGLDSISAIKVCSQLKKRGLLISVSTLLRASTIASIAKAVKPLDVQQDEVLDTANGPNEALQDMHIMLGAEKTIPSQDIETYLPTTAGQEYMLRVWEQSRGRLFFDTFYFTLPASDVSVENLERAMTAWVIGRPILRTSFTKPSTETFTYIQGVFKADALDIVHDVHGPTGAPSSLSTKQAGILYPQRKLSITSEDHSFWVRVMYERYAGQEWRIGVQIHHALYDGVSLPALLADLEALVLNKEPPLSSPNIESWTNFVAKSCSAARRTQAKDFWTRYLHARSGSLLRCHRPDLDIQRTRFSRYLPAFIKNAGRLRKACKVHGITLPSLFLAIYARALGRINTYFGHLDGERSGQAVVGAYIANRGHDNQGLRRYPTVNLLPVVVDTTLSIIDAAAKVQSDLIEISAATNVVVSLAEIQRWTGVQVDTFVNWVQLPGQEDTSDSHTDRFRIRDAIDQVVEDTADDFSVPASFRHAPCSNAYQPVIDVEVAMRDGSLDLGIFGPCEMLAREQVDGILEAIQDGLCDVAEAV